MPKVKHTLVDLFEGGSRKIECTVRSERDLIITIADPERSDIQQVFAVVEIWDGELRVLAWENPFQCDEEPNITTIKTEIKEPQCTE